MNVKSSNLIKLSVIQLTFRQTILLYYDFRIDQTNNTVQTLLQGCLFVVFLLTKDAKLDMLGTTLTHSIEGSWERNVLLTVRKNGFI